MDSLEKRQERAIKEFKSFVEARFGGRNFFCFVYGSYPHRIRSKFSDLDFFVVVEKATAKEKREVGEFAVGLLRKHGLRVDDNPFHDVSYSRKVLTSFGFLDKAIGGKGFLKEPSGGLRARKIIEEPGYLNSNEFVMRLSYNAVTSKGKFLCGNKKLYERYQDRAWKNLVRDVGLIHGHSKLRLPDFVNQMIRKGELKGEDFLGYKENPKISRYLANKARRYIEKRRKRNKRTHKVSRKP